MTTIYGERGIGIFLVIAIVEHFIFTLVLAGVIYTAPASKPDDRPVSVEIIVNEAEKKKLETEIPVTILPFQRTDIPNELPPLRFTQNVQRYLGDAPSKGGLPNLPSRTRASNQNPDRLSLGGASSPGRSRDSLDDDLNATARAKPLVEKPGHYGLSERRGGPDVETQQPTRGTGGSNLAGNLATGGMRDTGTERVTRGEGEPPIIISGEVSGRRYNLGKSLKTEGKQRGGVQLSFKVQPDGTVFDVQIKPGPKTTVGEARLKQKAIEYVENIRFSPLPKSVSQVVQSGEIFIDFTTQPNR